MNQRGIRIVHTFILPITIFMIFLFYFCIGKYYFINVVFKRGKEDINKIINIRYIAFVNL